MKYESIEDTMTELDEIISSFAKTQVETLNQFQAAQIDLQFLKSLSEIEAFVKSILNECMQLPEAQRGGALVQGYAKIIGALSKEQVRIKDKAVALNERSQVLETVVAHVKNRKESLQARKIAIERVASEESGNKRPERVAIKREADRLKKSQEENT